MKNIGIIYGGNSVEHDISVLTGVMVLNSVNKNKYMPVPIYVAKDGKWYTGENFNDVSIYKNFDRCGDRVTLIPPDNTLYKIKKNKIKPFLNLAGVINCMHGKNGEDGSLSGLLNFCDIAFCSPYILEGAISQDKCAFKPILKGLGVKTLPYVNYYSGDILKAETLGYPLIVKAARLGSSIGIKKATNRQELEDAIAFCKKYDDKILIEKCLDGFIEINCAAYKSEDKILVSECEKPIVNNGILTFNDKYVKGEREFPAKIDKKLVNKIKDITAKIYNELFTLGVIRIDYLVKDKEVYLNEINAVPGSLSYYLFGELEDFTLMLDNIIETGLKTHNKKGCLINKFSSSVLKIEGAKGGKRL